MATSGSTNFTQTRNEIITDALTLLGVYRPGGTVVTADLNFCSNILNKLVKGWERQGIHLWTECEGALYFTNAKNTYSLVTGAGDRAGKDGLQTTLTESGSGTTLTVTSSAGMTASDNLGMCLDNNTIQWTTISSIPSSTSIIVGTGPTSTMSSGNVVFTYTTATGRPLFVKGARFRSSSSIDSPVEIKGREDFMLIPNKSSTGATTTVYYTPGLDSGKFYLWPTPSNVQECLRFTYYRTIEDFDAAGDNPDLPQEWLDVITLNLAVRVAPAYGKNLQRSNPQLIVDAAQSLIDAQLFDFEEGSIQITPNYNYD